MYFKVKKIEFFLKKNFEIKKIEALCFILEM